jgi:sugar/nucleoside kinase (ribokinase family)
VDRLGAGDAFMAGVIDGWLDDDLEGGLLTATALASLALGANGDHVVTTRAEVERLLDGGSRSVDR